MFIRSTNHTHNQTGKRYTTFKLIESVRTQRGPRHRDVLNLGSNFALPKEQWKELANRIEAIISRQLNIFPVPEEIERLARYYAEKIIHRHDAGSPESADIPGETDFQTVDINSIDSEKVRTVGGESIILKTIKELQLDTILESFGFTQLNIETAIGVITARLLSPASERSTHQWLLKKTSLDDLMDTSFSTLSQDRVYKVSDMLLRHKTDIESKLRHRETNLFSLNETILLYDLTNTFFEGSGKYNPKAHFGVSKEKRSDCPLVTLGLLLDADGFPIKSEFFEGNVSEPGTLGKMLPDVSSAAKKPIIIADAGIGTQKNIEWMIANQLDYIVGIIL